GLIGYFAYGGTLNLPPARLVSVSNHTQWPCNLARETPANALDVTAVILFPRFGNSATHRAKLLTFTLR
ncbi:hypothetical protein NZA98_37260, partial [Escherichia coli]|nr:hypothetical protein [Escherichia coli]